MTNYFNEDKPSLNLQEAKKLIVERAKYLVNQLLELRGNDKPPFLPEEYASLQGIRKIEKADLGEISAALLRFEDGYVIKVNANHYPVRQSFSCAHEIGHTLFSELKLERYIQAIEYRTSKDATTRTRAIERLCDSAATELLMPETVFNKYLSSFGLSIYSIERLASVFKVSLQASAIRIAEVSAEPCMALMWHPQKRTKGLRLAWCTGQEANRYTPTTRCVNYPSTLHQAYDSDKSLKCYRLFKLGNNIKRMLIESKGFGRGENRYVISFAYLNR